MNNLIPQEIPERWKIELTKENIEIVGGFYNQQLKTEIYTKEDKIGKKLSSHNLHNGDSIFKATNSLHYLINAYNSAITPTHTITIEEFKYYVLNEQPNPLFTILEMSPRGEITIVENEEGNVFKVGDRAQSNRTLTPGSNENGSILRFRETTDRKGVCAVFNEDFRWGININKIQHAEIVKEIPTMNQEDLLTQIAEMIRIHPQFYSIAGNARELSQEILTLINNYEK